MTLPTRDRVGFYIVPAAFLALIVQLWIGSRTDEVALYVFIASALLLSSTPFLLTFPASWRDEVSPRMIQKVPWAAALAAASVAFLAAAVTEIETQSLRIAAISASAGVVNLLALRLVGGKGVLATPSRWTRMSVVTGACIGLCVGFASIAPLDLVGNATCFGIYVAACHWLIRSVIDSSNDSESEAQVAH